MALQNIRINTGDGEIDPAAFVGSQYSPFTELRKNTQAVMTKVIHLTSRELNARKQAAKRNMSLINQRLMTNKPVYTFDEIERDYYKHRDLEKVRDQLKTMQHQLLLVDDVNPKLRSALELHIEKTQKFILRCETSPPPPMPPAPEQQSTLPQHSTTPPPPPPQEHKRILKNPDTFERKVWHLLVINAAETFDNQCTSNASPAFKAIMTCMTDEKWFTKPPIRKGGMIKKLEFATPFQAMEIKIARDMEQVFNINDKHQEMRLLYFYCLDAGRRHKGVKMNALLEGQVIKLLLIT